VNDLTVLEPVHVVRWVWSTRSVTHQLYWTAVFDVFAARYLDCYITHILIITFDDDDGYDGGSGGGGLSRRNDGPIFLFLSRKLPIT